MMRSPAVRPISLAIALLVAASAGRASAAAVSPDQVKLDFGNVAAGACAAMKRVKFTNVSLGTVTIGAVLATGNDGASFMVTPSFKPPFSIGPGVSFTVDVLFCPANGGVKSSNLEVQLDGLGNVDVPMTGTALGPKITVTPNPIDVGGVKPGASTMMQVSVSNAGGGVINVSAVHVTAANGEYKLGGVPMLPVALGAGQKFQVTLTFTPLQPGMHPGTFDVVSDDPNTPDLAVPISGVAGDPAIACENSLLFGDVRLGSSAPLDATCTNVGSSDLHIDLLKTAVVGANAGDFKVDLAGVPNGGILHVGDSARFAVTFTPTVHAARAASLAVASDDPNTPLKTIALQGNGVVGMLSVDTPNLDFGMQKVFLASAYQSVKLTNAGDGLVAIQKLELKDGMTVDMNGKPIVDPNSHPTWFRLQYLPQYPINVLAKASVQIAVQALPLGEGPGTATLVVTDDLGKTFEVSLEVTGVQGKIKVDPPFGDFGVVAVLGSKTINFTIGNEGDSALNLLSFALAGMANGAFVVNAPPMFPATLKPGEMLAFTVTFRPQVVGIFLDEIQLETDDAMARNVRIPLSGTGGNASLTCSPLILNFGMAPVGSLLTLTVKCSNLGNVDIRLKPLELAANSDSNQFSFDQPFPPDQSGNPYVLKAGAEVQFNLRFAPVTTGSHQATLVITPADNGFQPILVKVLGTGEVPMLSPPIGASQHDFRDVFVGQSSDPWTVALKNTGRLALTIASITATDPSFEIDTAATNLTTLPPGAITQFSVTFRPRSVGQKTAILAVTLKGSAQPTVIINARGNGVPAPGGSVEPVPLADQPGCSCAVSGRSARSGDLPLGLALLPLAVLLLRRRRRRAEDRAPSLDVKLELPGRAERR